MKTAWSQQWFDGVLLQLQKCRHHQSMADRGDDGGGSLWSSKDIFVETATDDPTTHSTRLTPRHTALTPHDATSNIDDDHLLLLLLLLLKPPVLSLYNAKRTNKQASAQDCLAGRFRVRSYVQSKRNCQAYILDERCSVTPL